MLADAKFKSAAIPPGPRTNDWINELFLGCTVHSIDPLQCSAYSKHERSKHGEDAQLTTLHRQFFAKENNEGKSYCRDNRNDEGVF